MSQSPAGARRRNERGASTTLVALLFGTFVITGLLAWSADAGQLIWERRQTQNAADAAALALAQSCAKGFCNTGADGLQNLVDANTINSAARTHPLERQCKANTTAGTLPICSSTPNLSDLKECPPLPAGFSSAIPYVEVRVKAKDAPSERILNPFTRANNTGPDDSEVVSCARAAWGSFTQASVAPVTFSTCELEDAVLSVGYGNNPYDPSDKYKGETALAFNYKVTGHSTTDPCVALGHSGMDAPGGFGWLAGTDCSVPISAGNVVSGQPGGSGTGQASCILPGTVVLLPIYNGAVGSGSGTNYTLEKFAAFYVTAVVSPTSATYLAGHPGSTALQECKDEVGNPAPNPKCIYGMFLNNYVTGGGQIDPNGDPNGPKTIQAIG